jgi:hypothetical protein
VITRRVRSLAVASFISLAAAAPTWGSFSATFPVRHVLPQDAVALIEVRVPDAAGRCSIVPKAFADPASAGQRGVLAVSCERDELRGKIVQALAEIDAPPPTQRFHVVILEASRKEGGVPALPASELKALEDFRKVMTYRSFRLDGETVVTLNEHAEMQVGGDYDLQLVVTPAQGEVGSIAVQRFRLLSRRPQTAATGQTGHPTLFDTAFSLKHGETVVLGASSSTETARVVLVTALP